MELKPGYKQTEVGVIPEDWDIVELGNIIDYTKGFAFKSDDYQSDGVRIIRVSDTTFDSIKNVNQICVDRDKAYLYDKWMLKEHDLVLSTVGSKPPMYESMVGRAIIIEKQYDGALLNQNAVLIRSKKRKSYKQNLLLNHFRTKRYLKYIESIFRGNANQASITLYDLFHFQLALPRKDAEQRAIAAALSDVDALITSLDQLIAKKRNIKQAVMQQLLTGKTRLPGFSDEWVVKKLGDISAIKTGKKNNEDKSENGAYPFFVRSQTVERIHTYSFDGEAILVPGEGGIGSIYHYINGKFDFHQRVYKISNFGTDTCGKFIYFCMLQNFNDHAMRNSVKATVDSLRLPTFQEFEFLAPSFEEQQAIDAILSDMDAEITALEQKRDKTRALKQGMMQELLTGKTRLL